MQQSPVRPVRHHLIEVWSLEDDAIGLQLMQLLDQHTPFVKHQKN
jgi:hypothetical protein